MRRVLAFVGAGLVASLLALGGAAPSYAADGATIDHSQIRHGKLQLLVSVPGTQDIDLSSLQVSIDGKKADASAVNAATNDDVKRTTILAIDTSASMHGARIAAARNAAQAYLAAVPDNVEIGIVTFDNSVHVKLQPSLDRDAANAAIASLPLKLNTALYAGVSKAVELAGKDGQRDVLVLSDGVDNTKSKLAGPLAAIKKSGVKVDGVFLTANDQSNPALNQMAAAGKGSLINATDPSALAKAFSSEADVLARQVLVTVDVPSGKGTDANVKVDLAAGGTPYSATAFLTVRSADSAPTAAGPVPVTAGRFAIPQPVMLAGLVAIGLAVIGIAAGLTLGGGDATAPLSLSQQIDSYGTSGKRVAKQKPSAGTGTSLADTAKHAAERALSSNKSLEARIATRLEGAGMALRPAEWLLLHGGAAVGLAAFGLLITGGNPLGLLLFLLVGAVVPWIYLGFKRSSRLKAFEASLADTLQLMAGSLSAGLSLAQSVDTIVREGTEPISSEFKRVIVETRLGVGLEDSLEGVVERMDSKDFGWVVMAIRIQREVGGNLAELLLTVAATLRERDYLRRHVRALSAEGRLSCWILGGLPPGFLGYLTLTKPKYVHPMFVTPIGWVLMAGMTVLLGVGVLWMSKVAKVEV